MNAIPHAVMGAVIDGFPRSASLCASCVAELRENRIAATLFNIVKRRRPCDVCMERARAKKTVAS